MTWTEGQFSGQVRGPGSRVNSQAVVGHVGKKKDPMTITVLPEPQKGPKLIAVAESMGMTAHELVSQAIDKIISGAPEATTHKGPTISLRGLLAKYGTAPSAKEIDQNR